MILTENSADMKQILSLTLIFLAAQGVSAQSPGVAKEIEGVEKLIITTKKNTTTIVADRQNNQSNFVYVAAVDDEISDHNWNFDYPLCGHLKNNAPSGCRNFTALKDIYWGWDFNYDHKNGVKNCFEVGVGQVFGLSFSPFKQGPSFDVGLGFGMRRYLAHDGLQYTEIDNNLLLVPAVEGMPVRRSRVDSWTFHVPVMVTQKLYKDLALSVGAWINFNTYVKGETQYYVDNIRFKEQYKGLNQRFCTVDLVGVIGLKSGIGFYGRWSPMSLFKDGRGPEFKTASMGVMLNF